MFFELGYMQHGGSGLGYPWETVAKMPVPEILAMLNMLGERRSDEAKAIRKAHGKR